MQSKNDSPGASRPSLLTPAQQAQADRNRMVSGWAPGVGPSAGRLVRIPTLWAGIGMLALAGAAAVWLAREPAHGSGVELITSAPATAATINDDAGTQQWTPTVSSPGNMPGTIVDAGGTASANVLTLPLERPAPAKPRAWMQPVPKTAAVNGDKKAALQPIAKAAMKTAPKADFKTRLATEPVLTAEQESDIILLSALLAHGQDRPVAVFGTGTPP